ncbi:CpsD/CapB family tyrosine-protein kinase [Pediococcus claussenii]|uniref:Tyrosine-protein kinase CpsD n=1 Tax=Pediococcus claussenii (strain ATCC BAA-344 / DSM 14800 / JCM 18046 / KCTC 3811 / LMG 21948 / P06) TaxID=701521 RepID=G8PE06_PEDCP|nr:CpsD/CapB family tyrosine-protein kinase [Pediococcus claussenii]AEV95491.1 tyrosine-protein kinase YwqD [Pediococcus claussenii ATCC BAA-344]ANZ69015.1 exopolysaccharide biosynthesis protein [Pediococcus claussenii]ANZ70831.1 exopolysaccharide biosynthesis protein [Pediococcus claussenii]KRN20274.1 ywqD protein [Pediococcus claussenii]
MSIFNRKRKLDDESLKNGVGLIAYTEPASVIAEQFRTIRTNIKFSAIDQKLKTIVFTSSAPSEGKSTVSNNVAVTWAVQGRKILLVDADLRRPTVHRTFSQNNAKGLSTLLSGNVDMDTAIHETPIKDLSIMTSGPIPPNPSELLGSERMGEIMKSLSEKFDVVIIDAPPVNTVTDAQVLAARADGTILVVPQGYADKAGVRHAKQLLDVVHAKILGAIMNRVTAEKSTGYYGGNYGGYYGTGGK